MGRYFFRIFLLFAAPYCLAESPSLVLGAQAGPMYMPRWQDVYGLAVVIGAELDRVEITGQVGAYGEHWGPVRHEPGNPRSMTYALVMARYGTPVLWDCLAYAGTGIGTGKEDTGNGSHGRELILPVVDLGIRWEVTRHLGIGISMESHELQRYHVMVRLNILLGPFDQS